MPPVHSPNRRLLLASIGGGLAAAALPLGWAARADAAPGLPTNPDLRFGDLGPRLIAAGAIDPGRFIANYRGSGRPLSPSQRRILARGGDVPIVLDLANAHFLLNLFWALGLTNDNRLLTRGAMLSGGLAGIGRFASTGGWTLGSKSALELYSSSPLVMLTDAQQVRLEAVAAEVYRPCCNNPTSFPDCNHGMAMLGLLELAAADGADEDRLFRIARAANAIWYPAQTRQVETYLRAQGLAPEAEPRLLVGRELFSGGGYRQLSRRLGEQGLAPRGSSGQGCGV